MSFIRTHIENRSIFMLMLITLLCISYLFCMTTLTYALAPLGVALLVNAAWQILNGAALVYTAYSIIKSQIKSLDEKIEDLEKEVPKLYDRLQTLRGTIGPNGTK